MSALYTLPLFTAREGLIICFGRDNSQSWHGWWGMKKSFLAISEPLSFCNQFVTDYKEDGYDLASIVPGVFFPVQLWKISRLLHSTSNDRLARCQRYIWYSLGHGTKPHGMILKICARSSMPKQNSLSCCNDWETFNCQIIPRHWGDFWLAPSKFIPGSILIV